MRSRREGERLIWPRRSIARTCQRCVGPAKGSLRRRDVSVVCPTVLPSTTTS